jgi:Helix-turn-helix of DDE superfamily endonuclease/DDE superfamily endonuclease
MLTYTTLKTNPRKFLALTGLTPREFGLLFAPFSRAYERLYVPGWTLAGRPRQRFPGGGRHGALYPDEQKLLFLLVYLKTYPLQVVLGEIFSLSQPQANYWIHRLLPVLRSALDELGALPERDPARFARGRQRPGWGPRLIIDGTERRRQRPKNPEKQRLHYSGKKKAHCDKNVVIAGARRPGIGFLSPTCPGSTHDKKIADRAGIRYPPGTVLYKDTGFQGYEPAVQRSCQAKKKAAPGGAHRRGKATEPPTGARPR